MFKTIGLVFIGYIFVEKLINFVLPKQNLSDKYCGFFNSEHQQSQLRFSGISKNFLKILGRTPHPTDIYLLKVKNRNTGTRYEICSKLTIKTPARRHCRRFGDFIVNFEHI